MVIPLYEVGCIRVTHPSAGRHLLYCYSIAAPRLACVKPAASVHPEPGSNSSLYNSFNSLILNSVILPVNTPQYQPVHVRYLGFIFIKDLSSPQKKLSHPSLHTLINFGIAKVLTFYIPTKYLLKFFCIINLNILNISTY